MGLNVGLVQSQASQIIDGLVVKTTSMIFRNFAQADYKESKLINDNYVSDIKNGRFFIEYLDWFQGSSTERFGNRYTDAESGESNTALEPFTQNTINGWNGKSNPVYEGWGEIDGKYSKKFKRISSLLNDAFYNVASFMEAINQVAAHLSQGLKYWKMQRLIKKGLLAENTYDVIDDSFGDTDFNGDNLSTNSQNLRNFILDVNDTVNALSIPSVNHLDNNKHYYEKTDASGTVVKVKPYYKADKLYLLVDLKVMNAKNVNLVSGVYQINGISLPSNVEVMIVNTAVYSELVDTSSIKLSKGKDGIPFAMLIDKKTFMFFNWYNATTEVSGPKLYTIHTQTVAQGYLRYINAYAKAWVYKA